MRPLLDDVATELARDPAAAAALEAALLADADPPAGLAASLLHRVAPEADLRRADLSRSDLQGAVLQRAQLVGAKLVAADLRAAHLRKADLHRADLTAADLRGAGLAGARFRDTVLPRALLADLDLREIRLDGRLDLSRADLSRARLDELDLRAAALDGTQLVEASLTGSRLEGVVAKDPDLGHAQLDGSLWTGSRLVGASFLRASLRRAGLAEVDWEGADLRGSDLTHASFHLGSSRSGLLPGGYPSQGTRTGFYGDDGRDLTHRAPEEIRKANLCGARLTGARVKDADFYLVDLRDAEYDAEQEAHFRACGAILGRRT